MSKKEERETRDRDAEHRQILPKVDDPDMFEWLESLFYLSPRKPPEPDAKGAAPGTPKQELDTFPEQVELRAVFGMGGRDIGPAIGKPQTWRPMVNPAPTREALVGLANTFLAAAQKDARALGRRQKYALSASSTQKGAGAYTRYLFEVVPQSKEYTNEQRPASDDDDLHRDRFFRDMMAHSRWQQAQLAEQQSSSQKLMLAFMQQQSEQLMQRDAAYRALLVANEELASKKQERDIQLKWAEQKAMVLGDMWNSVKSLLPAVVVHLTKGKAGIVEGIKGFVESLSEEQRTEFFGRAGENDTHVPGILSTAQVTLFAAIVDGSTDPSRISEFVQSFNAEQFNRAQAILKPEQIQTLATLAQAASRVNEKS